MRTAPTPSRRDQIVTAAAALFAERGFHGVSIDDIGAAVGVSGPALYRHFRNKDAMLGHLLISISEQLLSGARYRAATAADPPAALRALVGWQVDFALDNPALITVHARDLANLNDTDRGTVRRLQRQYVEVWVDTVEQVLPGADQASVRAAAHAVFGLINSTPHSALLDRTEMAGLLRRMALSALLSPGVLNPPGEAAAPTRR
ncbi:MAG: TetR/AcrR family transcriptional regulator [Actinobacteria bacterium]|nr:TetR/AcrR family transcriptional regulator [Actinomycetota bacterium]